MLDQLDTEAAALADALTTALLDDDHAEVWRIGAALRACDAERMPMHRERVGL